MMKSYMEYTIENTEQDMMNLKKGDIVFVADVFKKSQYPVKSKVVKISKGKIEVEYLENSPINDLPAAKKSKTRTDTEKGGQLTLNIKDAVQAGHLSLDKKSIKTK